MTRATIDTNSLAEATIGLLPTLPKAVSAPEIALLLHELLYGERGFALAYHAGLVTEEEAGNGVAARVETWLVDRSDGTLEYGQWTDTAFGPAIARALKMSGPAK